jgi:hypothetical protein
MTNQQTVTRTSWNQASVESFTRLWIAGESVESIASKLAVSPQSCVSMASRLRKMGVALPKRPRGRTCTLDLSTLTAIVEGKTAAKVQTKK